MPRFLVHASTAFLAAAAVKPAAAAAQAVAAPQAAAPRVQSAIEALAQDAGEYARQNDVSLAEAMRRLRAQEQSVVATDRIRELHEDRLAGISIEHHPDYRIVVLLTGSEAIPDEVVIAGGMEVPVVFRTGAAATRLQVIAAMIRHRDEIRSAVPRSHGMGQDPRTGELVVMAREGDLAPEAAAAADIALEALTGVPVRMRLLDRPEEADSSLEGGALVVGIEPSNGRRFLCTTGFVVTDGARTGIITAAHCPDHLTYIDPDGGRTPLEFVGGWGARYQDVQIHVGGPAESPLFYADTPKSAARRLTSWRNRTSTRAGDVVCRRGETSGYSCSQVEFIDYAPPGDLCGGPCDPVWVAVTGPSCKGGDSGGPIFNGTVAFGIVKGGNYSRSGRCNFYYYMSTDYLPGGWTLLHASSPVPAPAAADAAPRPSSSP